ncbi:DegQ family serine endoprotease [Elioraea sp. Yellowstone]|jgi:serine protease Do|uniref:DegQ family serine endoprotease n=1 Tax=Elioraea sp. Yellowstone TaxID=2592070 RepID=UPI001152047C|nr:DegQ family serine endoprotease [Elioraea sp. Yellowstone]TQF76608.1 DegQ family serine endoprotease [Elioraea sp. Yellowstone]
MRLMIRPVAAALALGLAAAIPAPAPVEARPAPESFADLAERLLPSVVNISTTQTVTPRRDRQGPEIPQFPPGSPFEEFFREFFDRQQRGQGPQAPLPPRRAQSLGSGFVIAYENGEGLIVTNNHVIDGADEISAILTDNTTLKAEVVGRDQRTDLALLRVKSDKPLTPVTFGNSDSLRIGDWVLAIGNPFGLGGSVTAGIVSARGRDIRIGPYDDFIQTDAAINRGNSGGPLFNMAGEVVGINTAIFSPTGGSIGIGFAIPSRLATGVIAQLREYGRARRGWLGVRIQQVTDEIAESVGLAGGARGALVAGVNEGGPAAKAEIQNGDIILEFNGQEIREMRILPRVVAETRIGAQVPVVVWRNGRRMTVTVTVGELPENIEQASATPGPQDRAGRPAELAGTGLKLSAITPELREQFSLGADVKGVLVLEVAPGSPAAERGIRAGDVIVEVQQEAVSTPAEVQERVNRVRQSGRQNVLLLIDGQQGMRYVPVPVGRG